MMLALLSIFATQGSLLQSFLPHLLRINIQSCSPDEAQRNQEKRVPVAIPAPDWHPGYKTG